ncbi:unnamed protein product [Ectocarpus fasciculatus]
MKGGERTVWTPVQLHDTPDAFISHIKTSVPFRPSVTMTYLFLSPTGAHRAVGGPIMSIQRSYTMHHRSSSKSSLSMTNRPFRSLYGGVFLSGAEAKHYGELFRMQGLSFAVEGVAGAKEHLAENVERAREIGDTLGVHSSLMPLALLSGVSDEGVSAGVQAVVDVSRVTKSAAARHRSRRNLCDHILLILEMLVGWVRGSQPILKWEGGDGVIYLEDGDSQDDESEGQWNPKTRCGSSKDLAQSWLRTTHQLFWGWRCDLLRYLDEDRHSDVVVVKDKARSWIQEISDSARMGLRLPMLRWHDHGRAIADGKRGFLKAAALARRRLSAVSAWLHCLDLSLSWDAAKVCDRVHARHLQEKRKKGDVAPHGGWPNLLGFQLASHSHSHGGQGREHGLSLPTTTGLLQLQRGWLDDVVAAAHVRDSEAIKDSGRRRIVGRRKKKTAASSTAAAVEAALTNGVRYVPAPATPDSARAPKAVEVRLAVVESLREDTVPEVFAHEITLMKYAANNRIDKSLHDSISEVLTSVLAPNPFPALTGSLAVSSISHILRCTVDSEEVIQSGAANLVVHAGEEGSQVFVAHGTRKGSASIYGSKPALKDIDVEGASSMFDVLPPIAGWVLDELGDSWTDVDVGISGFTRYHGSREAHHTVPSNVTAMLACACSFDLDSGTTPMEYFTRCAVHCASAAHTNNSGLLVVSLTARTAPEDNVAATPPLEEATALDAGRFSLKKILDEPEEVEDELAHLHPGEIVLEALVPFPIPTAAKRFVLVPLSIRLVLLTSDHGGGGCSEALAAAMFYDCVYSTAKAAEHAAARHSAVTNESGLPAGRNYVKRTRRLVLDRTDRREYLEAYRLVHHLRALPSVEFPEEDAKRSVPPVSSPERDIGGPSPGEHGSVSRNKAWKLPVDSVPPPDPTSDEAEARASRRMLRGPPGRLDHARRLLDVLRRLVEREDLAPEAIELLQEGELLEHAEYCTSYLLDTLAEQPPVRFEGAVESIKLRARLLLDRVAEMAGPGGASEGATRAAAAGADATREAVCGLAAAVTSMLDIVQLAAEADTHRCCPEMERAIKRYRAMDNRNDDAELPPLGAKGSGRRRAAAKAGGNSKKSAGIRGSKKSGSDGRFGRRKIEG